MPRPQGFCEDFMNDAHRVLTRAWPTVLTRCRMLVITVTCRKLCRW